MTITTDYPFSDSVVVGVDTEGSLHVSLRVPSWASGATVQTNSDPPLPATPGMAHMILGPTPLGVCVSTGTLYEVSVAGPTTISLKLPMSLHVERRYNNAAAINYG